MSYVLLVANQKGGVGKTTCAIGLACEWRARGLEVLLVDCDPQRTIYTWADEARLAGRAETPAARAMPASALARELPALVEAFDAVVIDSPPGIGLEQQYALEHADCVVIPCLPGAHDLWSMARTRDLVAAEVKRRASVRGARELVVGVLANRWDTRTQMARSAAVALASCGLPMFETRWHNRADHSYASSAGLGVTRYAPRSDAAREVRALCNELEALGGEWFPGELLGEAELRGAVSV